MNALHIFQALGGIVVLIVWGGFIRALIHAGIEVKRDYEEDERAYRNLKPGECWLHEDGGIEVRK